MIRTADRLAEEKRQLEERAKAVEEQFKALGAESAKAANVVIAKYQLGYAHANLEAVGLLKKSADSIFSGGDLQDLITEI